MAANPVVRILVGNAASVSVAAPLAEAAFLAMVRQFDDIIAVCEMADVDARAALVRSRLYGAYSVVQRGPIGSPESALALVYRRQPGRQVLDVEMRAGSNAVRGKVRRRPVLRVKLADPVLGEVWINVVHLPLKSAGRGAHAAYRARLRLFPGIKAGDFNETRPGVVRRLAYRAASYARRAGHSSNGKRLHLTAPVRFRVRRERTIDPRTLGLPADEHRALVVQVNRRRTHTRRRPA